MKRHCIAIGTLLLASLGAGCSMCQHPYDYASPTVDAGGNPYGGFSTRRNSILGPQPQMVQGQPIEGAQMVGAQPPTTVAKGEPTLAKQVDKAADKSTTKR